MLSREKKNLYLDVEPDNIAAIKCYKKSGFKFVKELKNYRHPIWQKNVAAVKIIYRFKI